MKKIGKNSRSRNTGGKTPELFRKSYSEKKFRKKILKRIFSKKEIEFVNSVVEKGEDDLYRLKKEVSKDDLAHLKRLAKEIKKNRGVLVTWKFAVLLLFFGIILVFNLLFKDMLLERTAENELEKVFGAKVEMDGAHLSLIGGTVSFDGLTVADREAPFTNLFELGHTELSVDISQIINGSIVIDTAESNYITFGTEREKSGALEPSPGQKTASDKDSATEELKDKSADAIKEVGVQSAEKIIASYRDRLESPEYIEETNERMRSIVDRWEEEVDETSQQVSDFENSARRLISTDPRSFESVQEARDYIEQVRQKKAEAEDMVDKAKSISTNLQNDTEFISGINDDIKSVIEKDTQFLADSVSSFGIDSRNIVSATAKPVLRQTFGNAYGYAQKALRTAKEVKKRSTDREPRYSRDEGRTGTTIDYPSTDYPRFLLRNFALSFGGAGGKEGGKEGGEDGQIEAKARSSITVSDVAFDPDEWSDPITVDYTASPGSRSIEVDSILDLSSDVETPFSTTALLEGYEISFGSGLEALYISSFSGDMRNDFFLSLDSTSRGEGSAKIELSEIELAFADTEGAVAAAVRDIVSDIDSAVFDVNFTFRDNTIDSFSVETDLDELLRERIGAYLDDAVKEAVERLKNELRKYLSSYLEENKELREKVDLFEEDVLQTVNEAENLESLLEEQEEKARSFVDNRVEEAKAEAEAKARKKLEEEEKKLEEEKEKQLDKAKDKAKESFEGLGF